MAAASQKPKLPSESKRALPLLHKVRRFFIYFLQSVLGDIQEQDENRR